MSESPYDYWVLRIFVDAELSPFFYWRWYYRRAALAGFLGGWSHKWLMTQREILQFKRIEEKMATDPAFAVKVARLKRMLLE